jgi:peptide/nickel transport system substrate-binding protein
MRVEPPDMMAGAVDRSAIHKPLFTGILGGWDINAAPYPVLAQAVPQLNTDSWKVFPDGRMETTYRLRPNLTWHDGQPLTADDMVFSRLVDAARVDYGLTQSSAEVRNMEDSFAPDPSTLVIRWKQPYAMAAAPEMIAHPRHLLADALEKADHEFFGNLPFWTTEYVGAGPFRIVHWERGTNVEAAAFDNFALGKPKITRIRLTWGNDPNVNLARLLAGDADAALDGSLLFEQTSMLKQKWGTQGVGVIMLNPTSLRYIQVQSRSEYVSPTALLDARVRKAILHSIDRGTLAETMVEDRTMVADTVPPPTEGYYPSIARQLTQYPYDIRRAEQLMGEVGYAKGLDGVYTSSTAGRFNVEVRGVSGGQEEQDTNIVAGGLREAGYDGSILLLPSSARAVDDKTKGTFPGLTLNNNTLQPGLGLNKWLTANVGGPWDNWTGGNRMGWSNQQFDQLYEQWVSALEPAQSVQLLGQMMRVLSEELPSLPLYYNFQIVAHVAELQGPEAITPDNTRYGNIHQWQWR